MDKETQLKVSRQNLVVAHISSETQWRGGQRQILFLHKELLKLGIESHIIANEKGELLNQAKKQGLSNIHAYCHCANPFRSKKAMTELMRALKITLINFHDSKSLMFSRPAYSAKKVETRRVSYPIKFFSRWKKYSPMDAHVGVSSEITEYLKNFFSNCVTIHSASELSKFQKDNFDFKFKKNQKNLLFVGAFSPQKGIDVLIKSLPYIEGKFHLHLIGNDNTKYAQGIKKILTELNLNQLVTFYGQIEDIVDYYLSCDAVVFPSVDGEGASAIIRESLAASKTIIASDIKANKEFISDGENGLLFESNNEKSLAQTINKVIAKNTVLSPQKIRESSLKYSSENMAKEYLNLYRRL